MSNISQSNISYSLLDLPESVVKPNPINNGITIHIPYIGNIYKNIKLVLLSNNHKYSRIRAIIGWNIGSICTSFIVSSIPCNCNVAIHYGRFCSTAITRGLFSGLVGGCLGTFIGHSLPDIIHLPKNIAKYLYRELRDVMPVLLCLAWMSMPIIIGSTFGGRRK